MEDAKQYNDPMMDDVRIESSSNPINSNIADDDNHVGTTATKRKTSPTLEEQRIMAETEYYREKAAYFRIQKHLAFLQAKKVKYELEQLYGRK